MTTKILCSPLMLFCRVQAADQGPTLLAAHVNVDWSDNLLKGGETLALWVVCIT